MRRFICIMAGLLFVQLCMAQTTNPNYDADLAARLGADDYGMKNFMLVILKTGTNTTKDKAFIDSCFTGHMSNMSIMEERGQLVVAGPFAKNEDSFRGLFILNTSSFEQAMEILQTDPAINANLLEPVLYKWYGSAALPEYLPAADKVWKTGF